MALFTLAVHIVPPTLAAGETPLRVALAIVPPQHSLVFATHRKRACHQFDHMDKTCLLQDFRAVQIVDEKQNVPSMDDGYENVSEWLAAVRLLQFVKRARYDQVVCASVHSFAALNQWLNKHKRQHKDKDACDLLSFLHGGGSSSSSSSLLFTMPRIHNVSRMLQMIPLPVAVRLNHTTELFLQRLGNCTAAAEKDALSNFVLLVMGTSFLETHHALPKPAPKHKTLKELD